MIHSLQFVHNSYTNKNSNIDAKYKISGQNSEQVPQQTMRSGGLQQDTVSLTHSLPVDKDAHADSYHRILPAASDAVPNGYLQGLRSEPASSGISAAEQALARLQFDLRGLDLSVDGSFGAEKLQNRIDYISSLYTSIRQTIQRDFPPSDRTRMMDSLKAQIDAAERKISSGYSELLENQVQKGGTTGQIKKVCQSSLSVMAQRAAQYHTNQIHAPLSEKLNQYA